MKATILFFLLICFFGCNEKKEQLTVKTKFKMYQMSEMSLLMNQMYVDNLRLKEIIINKMPLGNFQDYFLKIHSSKFTYSSDDNIFFKNNAKSFINAQKLIFLESTHAKENFNTMVNACITCHEGTCGGPIVKIKKLYISNTNDH